MFLHPRCSLMNVLGVAGRLAADSWLPGRSGTGGREEHNFRLAALPLVTVWLFPNCCIHRDNDFLWSQLWRQLLYPLRAVILQGAAAASFRGERGERVSSPFLSLETSWNVFLSSWKQRLCLRMRIPSSCSDESQPFLCSSASARVWN